MLVEIVIAWIAILGSIYFYLSRNYNYWKKKGIVCIEPKFPLGILHDHVFGINHAGATNLEYYNQYKKQGLKFVGAYMLQQPMLLILDLDLAKQIITKDFNYFVNRDFTPTTHEFISKHLFALEGQEWREMRVKLSPTFTSGKMKAMFPLMTKSADQMREHIDDVILQSGGSAEFDVKDLITRYTTDVIASCAFGLEVNSIKTRDDEFYKTGQLMFSQEVTLFMVMIMVKNFPKLAKFLGLNFYHKRISTHLKQIMEDTVRYRKEFAVKRNDFVDLMLEVKETRKDQGQDALMTEPGEDGSSRNGKIPELTDEAGLTLEQMTAQAFVFIAAGMETAGSTTSFCLFELAQHKDIQERLRAEIDEVLARHEGAVSYQSLHEMTYMDQVVNETLRRYASFPVLTRVCTQKYKIPGTDLVIDEGVRAHIPSYAFHHDPDIYPEPFKFDPERFSEENSKGRHQYAFLAFGEGPRICIGMRFGRLQVKIGLATILSKYELTPASGTPSELEIDPHKVVTTSRHRFSLKLTPRLVPEYI